MSFAPSGVATFLYTVRVRNGPSISSEVAAYYDPGQTVRYDSIVYGDDRIWISYISAAGPRRYCCLKDRDGSQYIKVPMISNGSNQSNDDEIDISPLYTFDTNGCWRDCEPKNKRTDQTCYLRVDKISCPFQVMVCGNQTGGPNLSFRYGKYCGGFVIRNTGHYRLTNYVNENNYQRCYLAFRPLHNGN
jgi:hypothetical protein